MNEWLHVQRSNAPLILAMPHGGTDIPDALLADFHSAWHARRDADWYIANLYAGLVEATIISTDISRSVIDVNRDPTGKSLYPGQATTELCPMTDFDGAPLYARGGPDQAEIARRRKTYFEPYHDALAAEIERLRKIHARVVVYDCHSIRSVVPRLFDGELPELNIGTNRGATCDPCLVKSVASAIATHSHVIDGRFRGGWTTRHYGRPDRGVHAIQMELAIRAYLREPVAPSPDNWPPDYDAAFAAPLRATLSRILEGATAFGTASA